MSLWVRVVALVLRPLPRVGYTSFRVESVTRWFRILVSIIQIIDYDLVMRGRDVGDVVSS